MPILRVSSDAVKKKRGKVGSVEKLPSKICQKFTNFQTFVVESITSTVLPAHKKIVFAKQNAGVQQ